MTNRNYFASNIKYLRKINRLTQKDLAKKLGKTPNAISNWEQGIRQPTVNDLAIVCNYFNIDIMDIFEEDLSVPSATDPIDKLHRFINQNNFADYEIEELTNYARWIVEKRHR